jgi:hypothetical protein
MDSDHLKPLGVPENFTRCLPVALSDCDGDGWVPKIVSSGEETAIGDAESLAEAKQGAGVWAILIVAGEILGDA